MNKWVMILILLTAAWLGLMIWASHWGYVHRDPVRIEQPR